MQEMYAKFVEDEDWEVPLVSSRSWSRKYTHESLRTTNIEYIDHVQQTEAVSSVSRETIKNVVHKEISNLK